MAADPIVLILDDAALAQIGDSTADRLLQTTNGDETVGEQLQSAGQEFQSDVGP